MRTNGCFGPLVGGDGTHLSVFVVLVLICFFISCGCHLSQPNVGTLLFLIFWVYFFILYWQSSSSTGLQRGVGEPRRCRTSEDVPACVFCDNVYLLPLHLPKRKWKKIIFFGWMVRWFRLNQIFRDFIPVFMTFSLWVGCRPSSAVCLFVRSLCKFVSFFAFCLAVYSFRIISYFEVLL